jgi:hypothetical protein
MTFLFFSLYLGLLRIFSNQPVSHTELLTPSSVAAPKLDQSRIQPISYSPTNKTVVGIVPSSAFPSCQDAVGGILYVTRTQHSPTTVEHSNVPSDGPTCATSSSSNSASADAGESVYVIPLTEDGTLSDRPCMIFTVPQQHCEIPAGSLLSAFPLA